MMRALPSSVSLLCGIALCSSLLVAFGTACTKKAVNNGDAGASEPGERSGAAKPVEERIAKAASPKSFAIAYTASVQGYVTPCGCTAEPLGGVARLSALLDELDVAYDERVLFLDAGDLLFEKADDNLPADKCQAEARIDLLLSTYARKGLVATVRGPLDDVRGASFRDERLAKYGIVTLGVPDAGRPLQAGAKHETGILQDMNGIKVGITGVTLPEGEGALDSHRAALASEALRLREAGASIVVVLAQATRPAARRLTADLSAIDVVILGRRPGELPSAPERLGAKGPLLVAAGMQAQHLGILEFHLENRVAGQPLTLDERVAAAERRARLLDVRIEQYEAQIAELKPGPRKEFLQKRVDRAKGERADVLAGARTAAPPQEAYVRVQALPLPRGSTEERRAAEELAAYEKEIPTLVASCEAGIVCEKPAPGAPVYVGANSCQGCHAQAFAFWREQKVESEGKDKDGNVTLRTLSHASAWQTLVADKKDKDRTCIGCHSVGFNEPGGYCRSSDVGDFKGVQCESCHGPGSLHVQSGGAPQHINRVVKESTCRGCHQVPHIPTTESFVYEDKLKWILGPGHGEERLRGSPASSSAP